MINLPIKSPKSLKYFFENEKPTVYRYILKEIESAVDNDKDAVNLFSFGDSKFGVACLRDSFEKTIISILTFFINEEMYEEAARCRDLIILITESEKKK